MDNSSFSYFRNLIYINSGIFLNDKNKQLLKNRLQRRLRHYRINHFSQYQEILEADRSGQELVELINVVSTNTTHFFRENQHFDFLESEFRSSKFEEEICIWSAASSTGEEAISILMTFFNVFNNSVQKKLKILATDIDTDTLWQAESGIYNQTSMKKIPSHLKRKYFDEVAQGSRLKSNFKKLIHYKYLNLNQPFPFSQTFDFILCRKVMIYFDKATQKVLANRFYDQLKPGGYLLIGHSEALTSLNTKLTYVKPSIYRRD
ncbi:protein-glutamate O-methyltransferase CheR [bacterium]|nr:protein-glutamate O-methyltransferase CheR [bacterium]